MSPKSTADDWAGSATSLNRLPRNQNQRDSYNSATMEYQKMWSSQSPAAAQQQQNAAPPRPPKEPLMDDVIRSPASPSTAGGLIRGGTPVRDKRISKLQKNSPLPHHSVESGYGTANTYASQGQQSREGNLNQAQASSGQQGGNHMGRRPSGPRPMTPTGTSGGRSQVASPMSEFEQEEQIQGGQGRNRKRDTFGTMNSQDTDTF